MYKIITIIILILYHFNIINVLEKRIFNEFTDSNLIKRPLNNCIKENTFRCLGMPSRHTEVITILSLLLYYTKIISLPIALLFILIIGTQRIIYNMHTLLQVFIGFLFGIFYTIIYIKCELTYKCFIYIIFITLILFSILFYKTELSLNKPTPLWVDTDMIPIINKKKNILFYHKIVSILNNNLYINWNILEKYLDLIIENIKEQNIKFDAVVGIKSGGAILSDYISNKLNIKNYKIKISQEKYNCNKQSINSINDIIDSHILKKKKNKDNYIICEEIKDNIEGKNIILIDEMISTGNTLIQSKKYLLNNKKVKYIYPVCISFTKDKYLYDDPIIYITNDSTDIWPWGYDN